jgi:predicted ATPase
MLTRIYVDNFRCLVNFELKLDRLNLLMGENGSGKTTVFEVLRRLQGFIGGRLNTDEAFPLEDLTRWQQQLNVQRFEVEFQAEKDVYCYSLTVWHDLDQAVGIVAQEKLLINNSLLFEAKEGSARLYDDEFTLEAQFPAALFQSGIAAFQEERSGLGLLNRFHKQIARITIIRPVPATMGSESKGDERRLSIDAGNFASWYRYLSQEHQGNILELTQQLRDVIPGFDSFSLREAGEKVRVLKVLMRNAKDAKPLPYNFSELSDGQRQLILLYTLLYGVKGEGYCLFLDEPDNYVALREIQPWLTSLQDACGNEISQAVLISHHPEITDYLAASKGRWFERPDNGPVRVKDMPPPTDGLTASETIARGWVE